MIAFSCSHCGMKLKVKPEFAGRSSKCPTCKRPLTVPAPSQTEAYVPTGQIDGTPSSLHQAGVDGGVTVGLSTQAQRSVVEILAKGKARGQRYVLQGEIARGGMGAVLLAVDCDLRREVAVKFMLDQGDARKKARFVEEAQITGQLGHPNIVPIYELGVDGQKRVFFSMKKVEGRSLGQVLDEIRNQESGVRGQESGARSQKSGVRPRDERSESRGSAADYSLTRLLNVFVNMCNGLAYAHSRGVVHRDLKPANIMLGDFGEVYVMDWGLAKIVGSKQSAVGSEQKPHLAGELARREASTSKQSSKVVTSREGSDADLTQEGAIVGTPVYMPPEQAMGDIAAIDARSDIYSLGAILYEILTLQPPVEKEGGYLAILVRVTQGEIAPPEQRAPDRARKGKVPRELSAIAMKALAKEQKDRYPNIEALRRDIELFLEGRAVSAKEDTKREMAWKFVKRNKGFSAATLTASVLIAVILFYSFKYNYQARLNAESAQRQAEQNYSAYRTEQEEKREQARKAVPAFVEAAQLAVQRVDLDNALLQISLAVEYAPELAHARLLKSQILIGRQEFAAARDELDRYLKLEPQDKDAARLAQLCAMARPGDTATETLLADILLTQDQPALAGILNRSKEKEKLLVVYRKQIESTWPGLGGNLTLNKDTKLILSLSNTQVIDLAPLRGMQLSNLHLAATRVKDLTPLRGMPLTTLVLSGCLVRNLSPLKGMPLSYLDLGGCTQITDLLPLKGMPLSYLNLGGCTQIMDLSPLRETPLRTLSLRSCGQLRDIRPLAGMPLLTSLDLGFSGQVTDLTPLRGIPLTSLNLENTSVTDLTPLKGMPLTGLNLRECTQVTDLKPLKGMPLITLNLRICQVTDLTPLRGMPLTSLVLDGCTRVNSFQPAQLLVAP